MSTVDEDMNMCSLLVSLLCLKHTPMNLTNELTLEWKCLGSRVDFSFIRTELEESHSSI